MSRWIALGVAVALWGCGTRSNRWEQTPVVVGPVVASNELVWLNRTVSVAEVLDPSGQRAPMGLDVLELPRAIAASPNGFLVTGGRGDAPLLDVVSLPDGARRTISVAGAYDKAAVSPDGRFAVLFYDPAAPPAPGGPAARNNNEITVVDLGASTAAALSLNTESVAPSSVVFSPQPGVAAVVMDGTVVLVELDRPELRVQVPLKLPDGTLLHPQQVLFAPDGKYLYVRTVGSDDVLSLEVDATPTRIGSAVNFLFFPGASGLTDIAVPSGPGFDRYVAALYSGTGGTAALLDATGDTSRTHSVKLSAPAQTLTDLGGGKLLMSSPRSTAVAGWEPLLDRSDEDALPAIASGDPLVGGGHAFFVHPSVTTSAGTSAGLTGVYLVDDGSRLQLKQNPLVLGGTPAASAIDPTGTLLLGIPVASTDNGAAPIASGVSGQRGETGSVVTVKPESLAIGGLVLDDTVVSLGTAGGFGFATHASPLGDVTFFPVDGASRASARRVYGFLAGHMLDQGETP